MKGLAAVLFFITISFTSFGQNAFLERLSIMDGPGILHPTDMKVDGDGNIIIIGNCFDRVDLNPGPDSAIYDVPYPGNLYMPVFILKLDSLGNYLWSGILPAVDYRSEELQIDGDGNIYLSGMFGDTLDFDISDTGVFNRHAIAPNDDAFLLKLAPNGAFQWVKTFGRAGSFYVYDIAVDHSGNILFTGNATGTNLVFHPDAAGPVYNAYSKTYYVLKYDSTGAFVWLRQFGSFFTQYDCEQVEVTSKNEVIIGGEFDGTVDFNPGPGVFNISSQQNTDDAFILKLDSNGIFQWARRFGNDWNDMVYDMKISPDDKLFFTGYLADSMDFDPGPGIYFAKSPQWYTTYVLKLDADSASFEWVKPFVLTDPGNVDFRDLHIDRDGGVYTTGDFKREFYVHPDTSVNNYRLPSSTQSTKTYRDAFIHKFDSAGNYMWAHSVNSNEFQRGKAVATTPGGGVLWVGEFNNTVDFGLGGTPVNVTADGGFDMFLMGMGQCDQVNSSRIDSVCYNFINPLGDTLVSSGQYQYVLPGPNGCDSVVNLDLTIIDVRTGVILDSVVGELLATAQGASFRWLNCDSNFAVIPGATSYLYQPVVNGQYAVEVTSAEGCVDTSDCIAFNYVDQSEYTIPDIKVYPNPANEFVFVDHVALGSKVSLEISDMNGRLLALQDELVQNPAKIKLPEEPGIYLLRVFWEDHQRTFRVVKQ